MGLMKEPPGPVDPVVLQMPIPRELQVVDITGKGSPDQWLLGLTEQQAIDTLAAYGWTFRIARRQGCDCIITGDWKVSRYNVGMGPPDLEGVCLVSEVLGRG